MERAKMRVSVIGCGSRGQGFIDGFIKRGELFELVALCDINPQQLEKIHKLYDLPDVTDFTDPDEFFKENRGDLVVIASHDRYHVDQCVKALRLGSNVFMEKPISDDRKELELLLKVQKETGKKVLICHELRYGAGFEKCGELIKNGVIGRLYAIDASERAAYWHWAQAYVRSIATLPDPSICHPVILAKCSHDLDLLQAYAQSECESVTSIGGRSYFLPENKPKDAGHRCFQCNCEKDCPYSAKKIYVEMWKQAGKPEFCWPFYRVCNDPPLTEEKLTEGIKTSIFGKCVYDFDDRDFVDHQLVQMHFKNGIDASLKMVFGAEAGRRIVFYGSLGEIVMDERDDKIEIMRYGKEKETIIIKTLIEGGYGHGGGDKIIMDNLYPILTGQKEGLTTLKESVESHLMGIAAEESRKNGGKLVKVHTNE